MNKMKYVSCLDNMVKRSICNNLEKNKIQYQNFCNHGYAITFSKEFEFRKLEVKHNNSHLDIKFS